MTAPFRGRGDTHYQEIRETPAVTVEATGVMTLLRAAPYEINGVIRQGKVHCIKEAQRTYCGQQLRYTGGHIGPGSREEITCKGCLRSLEAAERYQQETDEWQERRERLAAEREQKNQEWWDWYSEYLKTPAWRGKRQQVLQRAGGLCEGCRSAAPDRVHHLTYEHAGDELLYELVALCVPCHQKAHPHKEIV